MESNGHKLIEYVSVLRENGLAAAEISASRSGLGRVVEHVSYDSNDIKKGTLFVCKGAHFSEEYLKDALRKGAFAYVSEKKYVLEGMDPHCVIVTDIRKAMVHVAGLFYNQAWKKLKLVGITGTKGKSTTVYFVKHILDCYLNSQNKHRSAFISSIDTYDGAVEEESRLTTPEAMVLHRHFSNATKSGIEYLTMEVSSQALKYDRVPGIVFDVGCFLNIGEDHISSVEHPDFDDYFSSKLRLFKQCKAACVNLESDSAHDILKSACANSPTVVTFGFDKDADVCGYGAEATENGIRFSAKCTGFDSEFEISMHGLFNAQNALAAIAICRVLSIPADSIREGLKKTKVGGRMEIFTGKGLTVVVDYAHNKMSFESLFESTKKEFPGAEISIVFGCPGRKALGRRRELGEAAGKYADKTFITEEDAGEEPVTEICEEIAEHVENAGGSWEIIADRGEAIRAAIETAAEGSVVLVTGKGRETRQKRGMEYVAVPSDVDYVKNCLGLT
ncbi:MAG: UDP-N-acetylmuramoyl-L-alanyl-D-glutamate--2,6-diaminopimelate ligase [Clostridiales bacterium]|nr:UDP-N-acetylmuramoyl-L-alanyl-D-glutamate--2,6-diaminopimelate ligase [Clostridiales bacterium]